MFAILEVMKTQIHIYTDGSSRGNPGLGGWAYVAIVEADGKPASAKSSGEARKTVFEGSGAPAKAIQGLHFAKEKYSDAHVTIFADSAYVLGGLKGWLDNWVRNGWKTSTKKPVENRGQWETLMELRDFFGSRAVYTKVQGHAGDEYNERADVLAVEAALREPASPSATSLGGL
jgi:ribonuclease HI